MSTSYLARLSTEEPAAHRIMDALAEILDPEHTALALAAESDGRWAVELHSSQPLEAGTLRRVVAEAAGARAASALTFSTVAPRDWVKASLAGLRPVEAGRFVVHGRHDRAGVGANRLAIEIEAALAFGTGHHGTTRGCLIALDALVKRRRRRAPHGEPPKRRAARRARVLDLGTGSGVLAIAAAAASRQPVLASDIDAIAVAAAKENVRLNRAAALIEVVRAGGLTAPRIHARAPYDLVLANILLAPLKRLAAPIATLLAPGGRVILSGLLSSQANAARTVYGSHGLTLERRIDLGGWATLVMVRLTARTAAGVRSCS
jgi:ribosomal protein L11 methyltransferase